MDFNDYSQQQMLPQENQNARQMVRPFLAGPRPSAREVDRHTSEYDFDPSHNGLFPTQQANGHPYANQPQAPTSPEFVNVGQNVNMQSPPSGVQPAQVANYPYVYPVESHGPRLDDRHTHARHDPSQNYAHQRPAVVAPVGFGHAHPLPADARAMYEITGRLGSAQHSYIIRDPRGTGLLSYQPPRQTLPHGFDGLSLPSADDDTLRPLFHSSPHGPSAQPQSLQWNAGMWARGSMPSDERMHNPSEFGDSTMQSPMSDQFSPTVVDTIPLPSSSIQPSLGDYPNRQGFWQTYPNHDSKLICSYRETL
ncbi:hypothetical protein CPB86DRAFT_362074 [Serendipita vermifera]|nr:hypothetical protein CPB86DRAFT_362074 [Serendipita vermifera]